MNYLHLITSILFTSICLTTLYSQGVVEQSIYQVSFSDTTEIDYGNYFEQQTSVDSLSSLYQNYHEFALEVEKIQLKQYNPPIIIDGNIRIISLQNSDVVKLVPNDSTEEYGFAFEKTLVDGKYYLFRVQWFEGNNYLLLDADNGSKTYCIGKVIESPGKQFLVSYNCDIDAHYSGNGLQLFSYNKESGLKEIWSHDNNQGVEKLKWISENAFVVFNIEYKGGNNEIILFRHKKVTINKFPN